MLGRGGFSEVWKALDLVELKEVAVKVSFITRFISLFINYHNNFYNRFIN